MPAPSGKDERDDPRERDELRDDDALDEFPPLDGDVGEAGDEPAPPDTEGLDDDGEADLDDATGEDDPADTEDLALEGSEARETGWLHEPADAPDLDLGDVAITDFGGEASTSETGDEAAGGTVGDEDLGVGIGPERGGLDGGDEGPVALDEELRESDLPELDADDEGELGEIALLEAAFTPDDPGGLPWAAEPWPRVGAPVDLASATAVACAGRGALVAGRQDGGAAELVRVDLEGTWQGVSTAGLDAGAVTALACDGDVVAALGEGGAVMLSQDAGATFAPVVEELAAAEMALAGGALWVRTASGELAVVRGAEVDRSPAGPGPFAAMARDTGGGIAALAVDDDGRVSSLVRARSTNDGGVEHEAVAPAEACGTRAVLAVRGPHVAYAGRRGGVVRRGAEGAWTAHVWDGRVTALAFIDDAGTLVAATYFDTDDTTALVRLEAHGASGATAPSVVARTGPGTAQGGEAGVEAVEGGPLVEQGGAVLAMAYDDARGVVWVAGGFGVSAFAVR